MGALSENFLKLKGTVEGAGGIEYRGSVASPFLIGPRGDDGVWRVGMTIDGRGWLYLNPSRLRRQSRIIMETQNAANLGGSTFIWYADADNEIIGNDTIGLWGYPHTTAGAGLGSEPFVHFKFANGTTSGYSKSIEFYGKGGLPIGLFDDLGISTGVIETSLGLRHNNVYKRVYVGAVDSGGSGYRLLRVGN